MGAAGSLASGIGAFLGTPKKVKVPTLNQPAPSTIESGLLTDINKNLGLATSTASALSAATAEQLNALANIAIPGGRQLAGSNIMDLLQGKLPASVETSLLRSGAARSLAAGFGGTGYQATGTMLALRGRALEAMQMGQGLYSQFVSPYQQAAVSPTFAFLTAAQRAELMQEQARNTYQNMLLKAQIAAQPSQGAMQWSNALMAAGSTLAGASPGMGGGFGFGGYPSSPNLGMGMAWPAGPGYPVGTPTSRMI